MAQMLFGEIRDLPFADKLEVTSTVFGVKADQTLLVVLGRATGRESTAAFDAPVQVGGHAPDTPNFSAIVGSDQAGPRIAGRRCPWQ